MGEETHIPDEVIDQILHSLTLEDIVRRYINLTPDKNSLVGQCPFHPDEGKAFRVFPQLQIYCCDGCKAMGNVILFLAEKWGASFSEAARALGEEIGLEVKTDEEYIAERKLQFKQNIHTSLQHAMEFYHVVFMQAPEAETAREYMRQRGFTEETLQELKIGFALNRWDTILNKLRYRYGKDSIEILQTASLISERRDKSGYYDYFRNRIMFPIFDNFGKVIGFGGRALDPEDEIKYLNSREIKKIFEKSKTLYLLNLAQREAIRTGHLLMVEGYTDAGLAHQAGLRNTFASAGTAFTQDHALMLRRITEKIILCMDADSAGRKASLDAAMLMLNTGINVELILLPDKKDPADVILEEGERFKDRVHSAISLFDFALEDALRKHDISSTHNKAAVLKELEPVLRASPDAITCHTYVCVAAKKLELPFEIAARAVEASRHYNKPIEITPFLTAEHEYRIANILLRRPAYRNAITLRLLPEHFKNNEARALFAYFKDNQEARGDIIVSNHNLSKTPSLFDAQYTENLPQEIIDFARGAGLPFEEGKVYKLVSELQRTPAPDLPPDVIINSMLQAHYRYELRLMEEQIEDAKIRKDQEALENLMQNYQETLQEYHKLSLSNKD